MSQKIPNHIRLLVADRAGYRCEYCRVPELFLATTYHIDHIVSLKHGGQTVLDNLSFSCPHCNQYKGTDVAAFVDLKSKKTIRFYHPRQDKWDEHFEIKEGETLSKTNIGEATVRVFNFNLPERVMLRMELKRIGYF
ncbi:MAG: HNH endonuclease [Saprospiraceae bacterium]|nr:HNH endonuclease [Saprospiraceae bacterium]MCF8250348.1 HNH endonuclease [Saprospiraceae bacterium]MCF8280415.1 HNH endonuclease [Bacteroidales bacterium]MCF8312156.1 HNH endonuclease [Saprospiraceae bacterium]MCF8441880.1 HNH endonuclease [Saprospiraceae bacterium]